MSEWNMKSSLKKGEVYIGLATDPLGTSVHHVILLPGDTELPWLDAKTWATQQGGDLPTRTEALLLFQTQRAQFQREWYWTNEQPAGAAQYAWIQGFDWGLQSYDRQSSRLRVRAVRRVPV